MNPLKRSFVSAFLPLLPLAFCHGCGGGSSEAPPTAGTSAPVSSPATVNHAPTISGQVVDTVGVGETYDWKPAAADEDGDALHFTAVNLPGWASINADDGRITGTPGANDIGIYESITVTAADGAHQVATQPFSITVLEETAAGVASLQWETPPTKVNGQPLDDLAGYRILYGHNMDDLDKSVLIDDPAATSFEFRKLSSGVWYFAVIAVNASGLEGPPTTIATKSI